MDEEKKDKGFVIRDRRFSAESESQTESKPAEEQEAPGMKAERPAAGESIESEGAASYLDINFSNFIVSLSSSVLFHFGDLPDPVTNKVERNLPAAKQTIDILGMIQEKTKGNLDESEKNLIDGILFELRMRFVKEKEKG